MNSDAVRAFGSSTEGQVTRLGTGRFGEGFLVEVTFEQDGQEYVWEQGWGGSGGGERFQEGPGGTKGERSSQKLESSMCLERGAGPHMY